MFELDTVLWIVIPCYNEEDVLPITSELFLKELSLLIEKEKISSKSRILFINNGCEIVYGVRSKRDTDTFFKRVTAEGFYKLLNTMGAEVVYNHADYRLVSRKVLEAFSEFKEVNLFLRGMFPLVGFKSTSVYYERQERMAGKSHYPLRKMLALAFDGITSLSVKPIQMITNFGILVSIIGFIGVIWAVISWALGNTVSGWASMICVICFIGGVQLLCTGVIGQYIGKVYMETKHRPRYIISDRTYEKQNMDDK